MDTEDFLGDLHAQSYGREIDENESVWRSLPLFTVSFGFAASLLNYLASATIFGNRPWPIFTLVLFSFPMGAFGWAFRWFWDVIRIRTYRYVAPDKRIREYAAETKTFLLLIGGTKKQIEADLLQTMKQYYFKELAESASQNQLNNQAKAKARSLVAFWLTAGFALAFASSAIILVHDRVWRSTEAIENGTSKLRRTAGPAGEAKGASASCASSAPAAAIRSRGCGKPVPAEGFMSEDRTPTPLPVREAEPAKPRPPEPVYVKKNEDGPLRKN